jgi:hypothetical protein
VDNFIAVKVECEGQIIKVQNMAGEETIPLEKTAGGLSTKKDQLYLVETRESRVEGNLQIVVDPEIVVAKNKDSKVHQD